MTPDVDDGAVNDFEGRSAALTASPAGCAFLSIAEASGLTAEETASPAVSLHIAGRALGDISVWSPDHRRIVTAALAEGPRLQPFAHAVLSHSSTVWWFAPIDRRAQLWLARADEASAPPRPIIPTTPAAEWERYAQKPAWGCYTSTEVDGTCSLLAGAAQHAGDIDAALVPPLVCYRLVCAERARVYEVISPDTWRRLCLTYPAEAEGGLLGGLVVPDFAAVARDWDAVHLSLGGLLTSEQVRREGPEGPTALQGWGAEMTVWLRWMFDAVERLPDVLALSEEPVRLSSGIAFQSRQGSRIRLRRLVRPHRSYDDADGEGNDQSTLRLT